MTYKLSFAKFFSVFFIFFLSFGWLICLLSAIGLFYRETIVLSIIASFAFSLYISYKKKFDAIKDFGKNSIFVLLIALAASFATCYFATPTIFGGRDQGSISTAAISLAKNHNLKTSTPLSNDLFKKYGPGRALNFPGFDYTKDGRLVSRFPVAFTSYLASAYDLFGLKGIQYANFIPLFLFLTFFWLILREIFSKRISFLGFLLAATFFPFLWFAKYALTETYALFLIWTGIYFLIKSSEARNEEAESQKSLNIGYLIVSFAALGLSALTRIEGIIFFLLAAAYILLLNKKNAVTLPKNFKKNLLVSTLLLFAFYIILNFPSLTDSLKNIAKALLPGSAKEYGPSTNLYAYLGRIFFNYNILAYFILGLAGIFWLAKNARKNWLKPEFLILFITFPAFFYLISPMVTLDDPWFLRRFSFVIFPVLLIYSIYFLNRFFYHKLFLYLVLSVLIITNGAVSWRFFTLSENKDLLLQIEKISQKFGPNDLVLVDRMATGSGFSLASEPMRSIYGKQAVYFFNADDLKHINQDRYESIYLVAPLMSEEKNLWYADLINGKPITDVQIITNNFLEPSDNKWGLAVNVTLEDFISTVKIK